MVVGPDHGAVDHLELVGRELRVVQGIQDVFPQPGERPAPELPIDGGPLAKLLWQVPLGRAGPRDPENTIHNKPMVRRLAPVRMPDGSDEALKECPFVVGHQIACQGHLPRRDDLESQPDAQGNPFCQHNLTIRETSGRSSMDWTPLENCSQRGNLFR